MRRTALVVGAGIGGLAAGLALQRSGWCVRVLERAGSAREPGFALRLAPNALTALARLGVAGDVLRRGVVPRSAEARRTDGRVLRRLVLPAGPDGATAVIVMRSALHETLLAALGEDALTEDAEAVGFWAEDNGVVLSLRDGKTVVGDVLVGADGVGSLVRRTLHPDEPPLRRTGYLELRGVAHAAPDVLRGLTGLVYLGRGVLAAVAQASASAVFWFVSAPALPEEDLLDARVVLERRTAGWDRDFQAVAAATAARDMRVDEAVDREPIEEWGRGRVTLIGDAAHPVLPHAGQGAAQALEDAVALGLALKQDGDPAAGLRRYECVRARRTRPVVLRGRRTLAMVRSTAHPPVSWLVEACLRAMPRRALTMAGKY